MPDWYPYYPWIHGTISYGRWDPIRGPISFDVTAGYSEVSLRVIATWARWAVSDPSSYVAIGAAVDRVEVIPPQTTRRIVLENVGDIRNVRIVPRTSNTCFYIDNFSYTYGTVAGPVKVSMDLNATAYPNGAKMLVAKHGTLDDYPLGSYPVGSQLSPGANGRPRLAIRGSVVDAATNAPPTTETTLYLRLRDPADAAPYVVQAGLAADGDNKDQGARLSTVNGSSSVSSWDCPTNVCGTPSVLTIKVPANTGRFETILTGATKDAGDNYKVEVWTKSPSSTQCSSSTDCAKTATITMWKRIYLERDRMFRRGSLLARDVTPGPVAGDCSQGDVRVHVQTRRGFRTGQQVRFLHAPRLNGSGPLRFHHEDREVVDVQRMSGGTAVLTMNCPLFEPYFASDSAANSSAFPAELADGVGIVDDGTFGGTDLGLAESILKDAFVEAQTVPDENELPPFLRVPERVMVPMSRKWFERSAESNHVQVIEAAYLGTGSQALVHNYARRTIWIASSLAAGWGFSSANERILRQELVAHEIGHVFQNGHCLTETQWSNAALTCSLHDGTQSDFRNPVTFRASPLPEFYDGIVAYHKGGGLLPSEYVVIREYGDPLTDR